jgi:hypothetical protein
MSESLPKSLQIEPLMGHLRVLCKEIGPRPPTSARERRAAAYVKDTLADLGYADVREQSFKSQNSYGCILIPAALAGAVGMSLETPVRRWGQLIGGALSLGAARTLLDFTRARFPFFQRLIAQHTSQNVSVTVPARQSPEREVVLLSHLDTQRQRYLAPPPWPRLMKPLLTAATVLAAVGGLSRWMDALLGRQERRGWQKLLALSLWGGVVGVVLDEFQLHIEGASDNASGVTVLLGLAAALRADPLRETQVTLLFTGCEEPVCVGIERYLRAYPPASRETYWIDLDMLGGAHPCYATRHGISYLTEYAPDDRLLALAARTAAQHPQLGVTGKAMLTLDEVSNLRDHDRAGLLISSYGADGWLSHWHRVTDTLENVDQTGLGRAAAFTWALLRTIDGEAGALQTP